ncbi:uncharacterized protein LOC144172896 [Haemaphysalis longicornis]
MPDQDTPLHRVQGLLSGVNWRPTKFAAPVPSHVTCGLCHVIPRRTVVLPCLHTLCETCESHSVEDGNIVCPLDQESFAVGDCQKLQLPPATADRLKACCWNESQGCTFVGTLQAVLAHYEKDCIFHMVSCPCCSVSVLHQDLPRHYRAGCQGDGITNTTDQLTLRQGHTPSPDDIAASLDELKALMRYPYQDSLPALQSNINEVLEEATSIRTRIEALTRASSESEQMLSQALGEHSRSFALKLQSLEAELRDNQSDAIARVLNEFDHRLSEQLSQSRRELATTFGEELRFQLCEISAILTKNFKLLNSNGTEAETTFGSEMPWKLEKRHILLKLELMATESHACLELLRHRADKQQKQLHTEHEGFFAGHLEGMSVGMSPFISQLESKEKGYVVTIINLHNLIKSNKVVGLFTRWYRRYKYLQVASGGIFADIFCVYLKWGGALQGSSSPSGTVDVSIRHPDYPKKEDVSMIKDADVFNKAAVLGFQCGFFADISWLRDSGFLRRDSLTMVISFDK